MQLLTPKAIQGYASVLDYEAHILVRSMYYEAKLGTSPINPAHFVGRYALKYVPTCYVSPSHRVVGRGNLIEDAMRHLQQYVDGIIRHTDRFHDGSLNRARYGFGHGVYGSHR
jgi:hypothetical protein